MRCNHKNESQFLTEQEENAIPESDNTTVETAINDSENPAKAKAMEEFDWNAVGKKQNNYSDADRLKFE